jgi:uncharacterized lipoprotein YmbA
VINFEGRFGGNALLTVRWSVLGDKGKRLIVKRKSNFEKVVDTENYEAMVVAMNKVLEEFSREIAETIKGLS